ATDRTVARAFRPPHGIHRRTTPACHRCAHAHHPATSATAHVTGIPYPPGLPPCTAQHLYNSRTSTAPAGVLCAAFPARSALPPCRRLTRSLRAHPGPPSVISGREALVASCRNLAASAERAGDVQPDGGSGKLGGPRWGLIL